ncbi:efflux RND transporter periplasmic adaptor subunit [Noviluteimonas gilva]|uniref:Efflux RND transporter periplasmic adaptor subunit n=1 Tax=Noviluteimonas gilva TaxID=2682097 RepID=A0A7C9HR76_9GAMM|nr:efflux RND transporter periplasmic adaptor subunit [Lysobacter gilvus]MUV13471.1 efflux RND transporter periplasmic adaptor subunit [Lysobacter gilvus]
MPASADLLKELRIDRSAPPPARDGNKRWVFIAIGAGLLAVILGAWVVLGRDKATEVETAQVTSVGGANGSGAATVLDATGYIVARRMATVSAKITGKVREIKIEEGMHVEAGQVMATLDPIDADAERTLMSSQVGAAQSQIGMVQAQLKEAEANVVRLNGLVTQQLVAKSQFDQAVAERDALRAQLTTAQRNARVAGDRLRIADLSVDNTIVRAPFAGIVIAKAAQPGEIVSPLSAGGGYTRTGIGTIVDMDSLEVEVEVGEAFIGRVKPGMPTQTMLNAYPDWKIPGKVIAIIPAADRGKATVKVRVGMDQKDARIVPDMGARVSFLETAPPKDAAPRKPTVLAPSSAIVDRGGNDVVFVVAEDKVQQRAVKLGRTLGDDREIVDGLSGGDTIVLAPPESLVDGGRIKQKQSQAQ